LGIAPVGKINSTEESTIMNLALTDQFGISYVQAPPDYLQGTKTQRPHVKFPIGAERLLWVPAVILALGILKKYVALATEDLGQLPKEEVAVHDQRDLLTRMREAGW
jgi:fumarate hydratase class II